MEFIDELIYGNGGVNKMVKKHFRAYWNNPKRKALYELRFDLRHIRTTKFPV